MRKGLLNIVFYDKNDKLILFLDGLAGTENYFDTGYIIMTIDKMLRQFPHWNGTGDGTCNQIRIEENEIDFSQIPDEEFLKLKGIKKIVLETSR